jgi:hypothetical protein
MKSSSRPEDYVLPNPVVRGCPQLLWNSNWERHPTNGFALYALGESQAAMTGR